MRKQWMAVAVIVLALVLGAAVLARFAPEGRIEVGARAPDFQVIDLASMDSVSFQRRYRGAVTLLNVWATWCLPCRDEMPAMEKLYQALGPHGFKIAAVSIDQGPP